VTGRERRKLKRTRPTRTRPLRLPYGALVGVLLYLDLRARKERLDLDTLNVNLQASTA
jgi:hypothetical protein